MCCMLLGTGWWDLLPVVTDSVVVPVRGYGLKKVAPLAGYRYETEESSVAQAILWFREYQEHPENRKLLATILNYNQEDCLALKAVYEWLRRL